MGRPPLQYVLSSEQIAEMKKLSATKTVMELAKIYKRHWGTINYHLGRKGKPRKRVVVPKPIIKPIIKMKYPHQKLNAGKNYSDYLKIENERRKKMGLYEFKQK